jgi:hypothetical protein
VAIVLLGLVLAEDSYQSATSEMLSNYFENIGNNSGGGGGGGKPHYTAWSTFKSQIIHNERAKQDIGNRMRN